MSYNAFESDIESSNNRPSSVLWSMDLDDPKNEKAIHKWVLGEIRFLEDDSQDRIGLMNRNLALYKGIQYEDQDSRGDIRDRSNDRSRIPKKIVINHLYDLTQNRVSRLIKFKPAVAILPTNDEFSDKAAAKSAEQLLSHIWYTHKFEAEITREMAKVASIMGESYLFIEWDPDLGDRHPDSPKEGEKVPLLDENGKQAKDESGNPIFIQEQVNVGDVGYKVELPVNIFLGPGESFAKVEYAFRKRVMHVEEARLRWPKATHNIQAEATKSVFDFDGLETRTLTNETVVWEMFYKSCKGIQKGRYIAFTEKGLLENRELGYSHGEMPFVRFTDDDVPGCVTGASFFERVKAITSLYNNLTNIVVKNELMCAHPKWMVPAGSVNLQSLGNDITLVQYKGPQAPVLVQTNPTPSEVFNFRQSLKEEFQQIAGVFGVSRGAPPPGIKSGVALSFLNEQENERFNETIMKWNEFIRQTAQMTLSVAGDYYDPTDKRMMRVLGKDEVWRTKFFDSAHLHKDYDIRVQNASALSQSKAQRVQTLLDISERFPDLVKPEQVLDLLDFAQADKFMEIGTVAVKSAEAENEMLYEKTKVDVMKFEDHLAHWQIHLREMQGYSFKNITPSDIQQSFADHLLVHEMYLVEAAKFNKALAEKLSALPQFPLYYVPETHSQVMPAPVSTPSQGELSQGISEPLELGVNPETGGEPGAVMEEVPPVANQISGTPSEIPSTETQLQGE